MKKLELIKGETLICDGCHLPITGDTLSTAWMGSDTGDTEFVVPYCEVCMLERYDKP